jgi:protein-tyrosine kinase
MTFGVTSPHPGDGKSLVASNLAVSLALSSESDIVLVDLNLRRPKLHNIFFTPLSPGFIEAINAPKIRIVPTKIGNLSILTAGDIVAHNLFALKYNIPDNNHSVGTASEPTIGLEQLVEFRNILFSLEEKFDFVILDFPSIEESVVPTLFMEPLNGLIVVVNTGKTKKEDLDSLLKKINANKVLGFVFNRATMEKNT